MFTIFKLYFVIFDLNVSKKVSNLNVKVIINKYYCKHHQIVKCTSHSVFNVVYKKRSNKSPTKVMFKCNLIKIRCVLYLFPFFPFGNAFTYLKKYIKNISTNISILAFLGSFIYSSSRHIAFKISFVTILIPHWSEREKKGII